jgi:hypothetical protein
MDRRSRPSPPTRDPYTGPVPTIGQLRSSGASWLWVYGRCGYHAPVALAPLIIQFGPDASSDVLRATGRCPRCGRIGISLKHPSWCTERGEVGWGPLPTYYANGWWGHRPYRPPPPGSVFEGRPVDFDPPGPFTFGHVPASTARCASGRRSR